MGDAGTDAWTDELAQKGEVRFPIRRRRRAVHLVLFTIVFLNAVASAVSAIRGERPWGWWEIFSVFFVLLFLPILSYMIWSLFTGRPLLVVDHEGVAQDRQRLTWPEIQSISGPRGPRVLRIKSVTVVPLDDPRRRSMTVLTTHVGNLDSFALWLQTLQNQQHPYT